VRSIEPVVHNFRRKSSNVSLFLFLVVNSFISLEVRNIFTFPQVFDKNTSRTESWRQIDQESILTQLRTRKWNWLEHALRRSNDSVAKQAPQRHRNRERLKNTCKRSAERNGHSRFQIQPEEDGGGSIAQSWVETSSLVLILYAPPGVTKA